MTVRSACRRNVVAKMKPRFARIADRPLAHSFVRRGKNERLALDRRWPRGKTQSMSLADHGVTSNIPQLVGDLARRFAFVPQFLEFIDAMVGPDHFFASLRVFFGLPDPITESRRWGPDIVLPGYGNHNISVRTPPQDFTPAAFMDVDRAAVNVASLNPCFIIQNFPGRRHSSVYDRYMTASSAWPVVANRFGRFSMDPARVCVTRRIPWRDSEVVFLSRSRVLAGGIAAENFAGG